MKPQQHQPKQQQPAVPQPNGHGPQQQQQQQQQQKSIYRPHSQKEAKKKTSRCTISGLIIMCAGFFFFALLVKYNSLKPNTDISNKIPLCGIPDSIGKSCAHKEDIPQMTELFQRIVHYLDEKSVDLICGNGNSTEMKIPAEKVKSGLSLKSGDLMIFNDLIKILSENPHWGVKIHGEDSDSSLELLHPSLDWKCWSLKAAAELYEYAHRVGVVGCVLAVCAGLIYASYRVFVWRKEAKLQEQQEIFELVEKVRKEIVTGCVKFLI